MNCQGSLENLHNTMHLVIYYMTGLPKVDRVDNFIVTILFVSVQILRLATVTGIVEEQRIILPRVFHQPVHGSEYVLLRRLAHRILLVVCQDDHVLSLVAEVSIQVGRHVLHIIDASTKLATLPEIVDAYE